MDFFKLDMKYLSPLLLAYEDRIREKEDLNLEHEVSCHLKETYLYTKAEINYGKVLKRFVKAVFCLKCTRIVLSA